MNGKGRVLIAGTQSGVGKTTLTLGLMGALKKRGLSIKPFKVGPDYIDPQFHQRVTGVPSRNLDSYLLDENSIQFLFEKNCSAEDLGIIEGVMGLYDGLGTEKDQGSSAHLAKILKAPVVLVIDGRGMASSAAAMVLGYQLYDRDVALRGVIINNISGEQHYALLKGAIERDTGVRCLGYISRTDTIRLESRHLGLIPCMEIPELNEKLEQIISLVEKTVDLEALISIAREAEALQAIKPVLIESKTNVNIAYAYDEAFNFYYEDNLDLLREMGVTLIPFSPIKDQALPRNIHGIYLGGGFPEVFAKELEANRWMKREILSKVQEGMPIYGECGGFMYLSSRLTDLGGSTYEMVGIFDAQAEMTESLQRFGYGEIEVLANRGFLKNVGRIRIHEFHRSRVQTQESDYTYRVTKKRNGEVVKEWKCGMERYNCLGGYPHIHFYSNLAFPKAIIKNCESYRERVENGYVK